MKKIIFVIVLGLLMTACGSKLNVVITENIETGLILAKIHMVTKLNQGYKVYCVGLILAKIHMVTKHRSNSVNTS